MVSAVRCVEGVGTPYTGQSARSVDGISIQPCCGTASIGNPPCQRENRERNGALALAPSAASERRASNTFLNANSTACAAGSGAAASVSYVT